MDEVERMAKALGCPAFYSTVDTTEGKASRLEDEQQPRQRQKTGRRGQGQGQQQEGVESQREEWTRRFVSRDECRRVVSDEAMDRRTDRFPCEEGEEACDMCQKRAWERIRDSEEEEEAEEEEAAAANRALFQQTRRAAR
ncbi:hypothetical protein EsH8_XV_000039 [Colletotrichum jinshuiense]